MIDLFFLVEAQQACMTEIIFSLFSNDKRLSMHPIGMYVFCVCLRRLFALPILAQLIFGTFSGTFDSYYLFQCCMNKTI